MARTPEDEAAYARLFGLPQPAPDYAGVAGELPVPQDFQPEPEPELPPWEPPVIPADAPEPEMTFTEDEVEAIPVGQPDEPRLRSISTGGDAVSVGQSRSDQRFVTKDKGNFAYPTNEEAQAAAAQDQGGLTVLAQRQADSLRQQAKAESDLNAALAEDQRQVAEFDRQEAELMGQADAQANEDADRSIAGIASAMDAVQSMKVDPNRIWTQGGKANAMAGTISAFVGGFLFPTLGSNQIQAVLERAIDRDIAAQKSDIEGAQRNVANLRQLHALGLQQAETEAEQRDQDRILRRGALVGILSAESMKLQDPVQQAKVQREVDALAAQNHRDVMAIREREYAKKVQEHQFKVKTHMDAQRLATTRRGQNISARNAKNRLAFDREKLMAQRAAKGPAGVVQNPLTASPVGVFNGKPDSTANQKFNERLSTRAAMTDRIRGLLSTMKDVGAVYGGGMQKYFQTTEAQALKGEYEDLRASYIRAMSGAQASDAEIKRLEKALPHPETFFTRDPSKALEGFLDRQATDMWIDSNVNLRDNNWDPRREWGSPEQVAPREKTSLESVQIMREGTPAQKLAAAAEMVDSVSGRKGESPVIVNPNSREFKEAQAILSDMSEQERFPEGKEALFPDFKTGGRQQLRDVLKDVNEIVEKGNDESRRQRLLREAHERFNR